MHYVISDIHGEIDLFMSMLDVIEFGDEDTLFILGDVINRGKHGIALLTFIKDKSNMVLIRGNHEQMLIDAFRYGENRAMRMMCNNGGWQTRTDFEGLNEMDQRALMAYLMSTPDFYELLVDDVKYHLVHASHADEDIVGQKKMHQKRLWERQYTESEIPENVIVVIGHTPTSYYQETEGALRVFFGLNLIAIDCGLNVVGNGRLGCVCLETKACFYV